MTRKREKRDRQLAKANTSDEEGQGSGSSNIKDKHQKHVQINQGSPVHHISIHKVE